MKAWIVAGMAFGDEGKGRLTDYLVRRHSAGLVVRYNGGCQAAHNVIAGGSHHTFAQFGSGTLAGARTFLSRHMLVEPMSLLREAEVLKRKGVVDPLSKVAIDWQAVLITPWHRFANRIRELARTDRHGSIGAGVGEARMDQLAGFCLRVRTMFKGQALQVLRIIRERKVEEMRAILRQCDDNRAMPLYEEMLATSVAEVRDCFYGVLDQVRKAAWFNIAREHERAAFEGAQGVLLDERHGFAPHTTWTNCTFENAVALLDEIGCGPRDYQRIGVFRSYFTRHGQGPFPTEDERIECPEPHNTIHRWAGKFRAGHFDLSLAKYACDLAGPDVLAITHADRRPSPFVGTHSPLLSKPQYRVEEDLQRALFTATGVPVRYLSYGPCSEDRVEEEYPEMVELYEGDKNYALGCDA